MLVSAGADVAVHRGAIPELHVFQGIQAAAVVCALWLLGRPWGAARAEAIAVGAVVALCAAGVGTSAALANATALPLLLVALAIGAAALIPWRVATQIAVTAICLAATVATVLVVGGGFALSEPFVLAVGIALLASTVIARELARHRIDATAAERERAVYVDQLAESGKQLRLLSSRVLSVQEEERTRVAQELHDDLGQRLTALKFMVSAIHEANPGDQGLRASTADCLALVDETLVGMQRIARQLRPSALGDLGLIPTLDSFVREFQRRTLIACNISCEQVGDELDRDRATALFRILQEALTNVARHAAASHVWIALGPRGGGIELSVEDDGVGIADPAPNGTGSLGLLGMRERAVSVGGAVIIEGGPRGGTVVRVFVPLSGSRGDIVVDHDGWSLG